MNLHASALSLVGRVGVAAALATCVGCGGTLTVEVPVPEVDVGAEVQNLADRFDQRLALPFTGNRTWTVCRGYRVGSHTGRQRLALDLTAASGTHSPKGCVAGEEASDRRRVVAPVTGSVAWFDSHDQTDDLVCIDRIDEAGGGSVLVGHVLPSSDLKIGSEVTRGTKVLGRVVPLAQSSRSGYAHIHIAAFEDKGCRSPVPFTGRFQFECVSPLADDRSTNQHQMVRFARC